MATKTKTPITEKKLKRTSTPIANSGKLKRTSTPINKPAAMANNVKKATAKVIGAKIGASARKTSPTMSKYTSQLTPATGASSRQTAFSQNVKATNAALGGASTGGRARKTSPTMSKYTSQLTPTSGTSKKKAIKKPY